MIEVNYFLVFVTAIIYFVLGAVWYSPLMFGKWWMEIMEHDPEKIGKAELEKMQKEMMPAYIAQFFLALLTITVLTHTIKFFMSMSSQFHAFGVAGWIWLGFVFPIIISNVMWSQTKKKFWCKQIFVSATYQLVVFMIAAALITYFG
jgi:hypothetical protein